MGGIWVPSIYNLGTNSNEHLTKQTPHSECTPGNSWHHHHRSPLEFTRDMARPRGLSKLTQGRLRLVGVVRALRDNTHH